ncbi:ATP phosphoribosyltransferase regulatory subunit [Ensifer aridi]|uniref:ATP phosphoribosyltransferase regulatory subunit n=1 Tax=Ensifer aridi TaxID=1708715 RepID=UPI000A11F6D0|nr:ATP phosphoribosyltransferase regulatory subunit [Ensifer aridi]
MHADQPSLQIEALVEGGSRLKGKSADEVNRLPVISSTPTNTLYSPIAPAILGLFASRGAELIDVPILQTADPFLDVEERHGCIFTTESEIGENLCLRPGFTIPICLDHIKSRATARRYAYIGEVFWQNRQGGSEFLEAGIEDIGDAEVATTDARSIGDAYAVLELTLPQFDLAAVIGDKTIFEAVLTALDLPIRWQKRLARAFGAPTHLEVVLGDLVKPMQRRKLGGALSLFVGRGELECLTDHIATAMELAGFSLVAGRTPHEIATRLIESNELTRVSLPKAALEALEDFLSIRVPLEQAPDALRGFASAAGLALGPAFDTFLARADAMAAQGLPFGRLTYDAALGRPHDYYTGLVFEFYVPGTDRALVTGGRYDQLLTLLGADRPIAAVGFSVEIDRVVRLRETIA